MCARWRRLTAMWFSQFLPTIDGQLVLASETRTVLNGMCCESEICCRAGLRGAVCDGRFENRRSLSLSCKRVVHFRFARNPARMTQQCHVAPRQMHTGTLLLLWCRHDVCRNVQTQAPAQRQTWPGASWQTLGDRCAINPKLDRMRLHVGVSIGSYLQHGDNH